MQKLNIKPKVSNTFKGLNMKFNTKVNGIPCICDMVLFHTKEDFEYILYDRKGYRAKWLDVYITYEIEQRLLKEYLEQ